MVKLTLQAQGAYLVSVTSFAKGILPSSLPNGHWLLFWELSNTSPPQAGGCPT